MSTAAQQNPSTKPTGYEVARPAGACAVTGQPIQPGEKLMTALRETASGFERVDVSLSAWSEFDRTNLIAFWQTVMPSPQQVKKKVFVDDRVLAELFERLANVAEPAKLNFRFVLGLILMRKRLLAYDSTRVSETGEEIWRLKPKGRDELLDLLNPKLNEQQVQEVSQQLGEILNQEL